MSVPNRKVSGEPGEVYDEQFGRRFLQRAVTLARLSSGFNDLAGGLVNVGPITAGPRGLATVQASGAIASPTLQQRQGEQNPTFDVTIPVRLDMSVTVGSRKDYAVDLQIPLTATARYADPLAIVIDIPEVPASAIGVQTKAGSAAGRVIAKLARLDHQLRQHVAKAVNERLADASRRTVDVGTRIDAA